MNCTIIALQYGLNGITRKTSFTLANLNVSFLKLCKLNKKTHTQGPDLRSGSPLIRGHDWEKRLSQIPSALRKKQKSLKYQEDWV